MEACREVKTIIDLSDNEIIVSLPRIVIEAVLVDPVKDEKNNYYLSKIKTYKIIHGSEYVEKIEIMPWNTERENMIQISSKYVSPIITRIYVDSEGRIIIFHDSGCLYKLVLTPTVDLRLKLIRLYEILDDVERYMDIELSSRFGGVVVISASNEKGDEIVFEIKGKIIGINEYKEADLDGGERSNEYSESCG